MRLLWVWLLNHIYKEKHKVNLANSFIYLSFALRIVYCSYFQKVPDSLVVPLLQERLSKLDCVSRGWVLHGFPKTRDQAEALESHGFIPNR